MNVPNYTPGEMVRMELLSYQNPEGLHPVEEDWRNLCRKLMQHTKFIQGKLVDKKADFRFDIEMKNWIPFKFPEPFQYPQPQPLND